MESQVISELSNYLKAHNHSNVILSGNKTKETKSFEDWFKSTSPYNMFIELGVPKFFYKWGIGMLYKKEIKSIKKDKSKYRLILKDSLNKIKRI